MKEDRYLEQVKKQTAFGLLEASSLHSIAILRNAFNDDKQKLAWVDSKLKDKLSSKYDKERQIIYFCEYVLITSTYLYSKKTQRI